MSDDGNDENTSMPSGHETEDEDTEIFDAQARADIAALKEKVAELELKQTPRAQNARRERIIGGRIAAEIKAEPAIQEEIEKARATIQGEARKQLTSIASALESTGKWVTATKLAADKATEAATQAKAAATQAVKASEKQPDTDAKFEAVNNRVTLLQDKNNEEWVGVKTTVKKTMEELTDIITQKADKAIQVKDIKRGAFTSMDKRMSELEKRLSTLETLTDTSLTGPSGGRGESVRYKI
jgi:hypothetical protein